MQLRHRIPGVAVCLALVADPAGATTIDGTTEIVSGTIRNFPQPLVVGATGPGALEVLNGGQAYPAQDTTLGRDIGATGSVVVDGAGSRFTPGSGTTVTVGDAGAGRFSVRNGGVVPGDEYPELTVLGSQASGTGHVTLTGSGSLWDQRSAFVLGRSGSALFEVSDGAQLFHDGPGIQLGLLSGSSGRLRVSGPGASWIEQGARALGDALSVGVEGFGAVEILDGATSSRSFGANDVVLGVEPTGRGELWVSGAGASFDHAGNLFVGERGSGLLVLRDQGVLRAADLSLGNQAGGSGTLRLEDAGSGFALTGSFYVGKAGEGRFEVRNGATATVTGTFTGDSTYIGFAPGSSGHVLVEGPGSSWLTAFPGAIHIGEDGTGTLELLGGAIAELSSHVRLGVGASGRGSLLVEGTGGRFSTGFLSVGDHGHGDVTLRDGASVWGPEASVATFGGSTGSVVVEGAGTEWVGLALDVGQGGTGTFTSRDGARIDVRDEIVLGRSVGGVGTLELLGPATRLDATTLTVGELGDGNLRISGGARAATRGLNVDGASRVTIEGASASAIAVNVGSIYVPRGGALFEVTGGGSLSAYSLEMQGAAAAPSRLRIEGLGSSATFADDILIGTGGPADVHIGAGGRLTSQSSDVGGGGHGSVIVEGAGSHWSTGRVRVANAFSRPSSSGSVQVRSGGVVETTGSSGEVWVGQITGATGSIEVNGPGSRWRANGLGIAGSTVSQGGGTGSARIADGGVFDASGGKVAVWQNGTLELDGGSVLAQSVEIRGALEGDGAIAGNLTNRGAIAPGHSPGRIDIDGSYTQSASGLLEIEIFGAADGDFDLLAISGDAFLDGVLSVHVFGDPFALAGIPIYVLEADSITGSFQALQATGIDPGLLQLATQGGRASITIIPEPTPTLLLAAGLLILARLRRQPR